jgi:hypothetical protein
MRDRRLLEGIPRIRRARGFRLYDMEGRRYLDLYRDGALLGHRAAGVLTSMKSILSQGLTTALPTVWEGRLVSTIRSMLPGGGVRLYASPENALDAAGRILGAALSWEDVHDPAAAAEPGTPPRAALWRPFLPSVAGAGVLLLQLPFTVCGAPMPVRFPDTSDAPPSDLLPGFILAGAARGLAALQSPAAAQLRGSSRKGGIRRRDGGIFEPDPPAPSGVRALECAIDQARGWKRRGPYVIATFPEGDYPRVHAEFLSAGVLLFPGYPGPSVLPGECSPGENRLLADLFTRIPGG